MTAPWKFTFSNKAAMLLKEYVRDAPQQKVKLAGNPKERAFRTLAGFYERTEPDIKEVIKSCKYHKMKPGIHSFVATFPLFCISDGFIMLSDLDDNDEESVPKVVTDNKKSDKGDKSEKTDKSNKSNKSDKELIEDMNDLLIHLKERCMKMEKAIADLQFGLFGYHYEI